LSNRQIPGIAPPATTASGKPRLNKKGKPKGYRIDDFHPGSGTEQDFVLEQKAGGTIDREQKEKDAKGILVDDKIIEETRNLGYAGCLGNVPKE
jgi:hypothetical protein